MALTPARYSPSPIPRASATARPTASPNATATLSPDAVATKLAGVQTLFAALPHTSVESDLTMLAAQMVSSGAFKTAVVNPGGITSVLPDGTTAQIFADKPEDVEPSSSAAAVARHRSASTRSDLPLSAANAHEVAFLVNETDAKAFTPSRQTAFANAFTTRGFNATNGYGVDDLDVTLPNIAALAGRGIDFLDIATHGSVDGLGPLYFYAWLSDTPVNAANQTTYATAIANGSLQYGTYLSLVTTRYVPTATYSFTPQYLANVLTFNEGAFVDNASCFGENAQTLSALRATLTAANVGKYFGWTLAVDGTDADGTDGFLLDRLLGEQSPATGLAAYAPQMPIPQPPFGLDDVYAVLNSEMRNSPFQQPPPGYTYTQSPSTSTAYALFNGFFTGNGTGNPPIEYGMPSIANLLVTENPSAPTMEIDGEFPPVQGTVTISDSTGSHPLTVTSWAQDAINVTIPSSGAGSGGDVQVVSATGIVSNTVPLTKWTGSLTSTENDTFDTVNGVAGSGTGTIGAQYTIDFRADVHPYFPGPDASPVAQNLTFQNLEGDSTANVTAYTGGFNSTSQDVNGSKMPLQVTYSLGAGASTMPVSLVPLQAPSFAMGSIANQPSPCNDGNQGITMAGTSNIFCPALGFASFGVNQCADNQSGLGCSVSADPRAAFDDGNAADGLLELTMNPSTYAISVSATVANSTSLNFTGQSHQASGTINGTINAPVDPPMVTTPVTTMNKVVKRLHRAAIQRFSPSR